jgi:hypothetical protein
LLLSSCNIFWPKFCTHFSCFLLASYPIHLVVLYLIIMMIKGEKCKLLRSLLCTFLSSCYILSSKRKVKW